MEYNEKWLLWNAIKKGRCFFSSPFFLNKKEVLGLRAEIPKSSFLDLLTVNGRTLYYWAELIPYECWILFLPDKNNY